MAENLKDMYKNINKDAFPQFMDISFRNSDSDRQTLFYEKVQWDIAGEKLGLRYGENPDQPAAMYKLINGNLAIGGVETVLKGRYLASDVELLQSGKHPGKINITDVDNGLNILRYFTDTPCSVIIKHNNPSGVAKGETLADAFHKSLMADRIAAFGGAVILNREVDLETAELVTEGYVEVVAAPEFSAKAFELFQTKKNLRVMRIKNIDKLQDFAYSRFMDFKSILDGGVIAQWSYLPKARTKDDFLPAVCEYKGTEYRVNRQPTDKEYEDMIFGWLVESGVTSNSVIYVKDGVTVGIGTGEQDRVGVAEIARDKAYKKMCDRICWDLYAKSWYELTDPEKRASIESVVNDEHGGLKGAVMVSDAFFPFRDGIDIGLKEGVTAVVQPGGSLRDFESIIACNEYNAAMVYTGQRSFRH
ncbi:MAG: IMP cyclohydrolase [Spirochaetia bacterium]|nr:IMP cyclohydrolase [Spirochaetia bacterium]MBQ6673176.1 IMP cyclohydrolase [Spirochaetia bacterium]MBR0318815.1 IMP cyclohydrolase [Spirochaetia bacterium]